MAGRSYDEGKLTYLELLETQRTWIETQIEYAHALFAYRATTAALERAIAWSPCPLILENENGVSTRRAWELLVC